MADHYKESPKGVRKMAKKLLAKLADESEYLTHDIKIFQKYEDFKTAFSGLEKRFNALSNRQKTKQGGFKRFVTKSIKDHEPEEGYSKEEAEGNKTLLDLVEVRAYVKGRRTIEGVSVGTSHRLENAHDNLIKAEKKLDEVEAALKKTKELLSKVESAGNVIDSSRDQLSAVM